MAATVAVPAPTRAAGRMNLQWSGRVDGALGAAEGGRGTAELPAGHVRNVEAFREREGMR